MANLPTPHDAYDPRWAADLVRAIEDFQAQQRQPAQTGYTTSNVTTTRTLNVSTATLADVANVLGTLINDLKAVGRLG